MVLIKKVGRAKIPITWIKSDASRHVTFTKRKKGLKKKVEELAILCGVEVCMICFGPQHGKPTSLPYSWGLPGVSQVIDKYRSLSKEEQDKKKLDNTSLLEQQIKKLKSELRSKREQNQNIQNERTLLLWDDRLYTCGVDELKHLADMVFSRMTEVHEKIAYVSQQHQDMLALGSNLEQHTSGVSDGGKNSTGEVGMLSTVPPNCEFTCEVRMPGTYQKLIAGIDPLNNFGEGLSSRLGAVMMNMSAGSEHGLINQISHLNLPAFIERHKAVMPIDSNSNCTNGNFYHNMDAMLPTSTDMSYLSSPTLSMRARKQEELSELNPTTLHGLTEPHVLSNMTWQQAVGLEADDNLQCCPTLVHPNEHNDEKAWSIERTVDSGNAEQAISRNAAVIEREGYDAMTIQNVNIHLCHGSGIEDHKGSEIQVNTNGLQTGICHLDVPQVSAPSNELAYQETAEQCVLREGSLMWNLEEEVPKTSSVYQSHMLEVEGPLSSLHDQDGVDTDNDVRVINY